MKINCEYSKLENIENLKPHNRNPNKHGDRQIEIVAKLIDHHGWRHPIIVSKLSDKIVAGHCRLDAAKKLGYEKVPVDYQEFEDEIAEFRFLVSDNKSSYMSEHDDSFMIDGIKDLELDDSDFELMGLDGFEIEKEDIEDDEKYTRKVESPIYEPLGEKPELKEIFSTEKTDELIKEIEDSNVDEKIKYFLRLAAHRHTKFNYKYIAEYYAHADKETQPLSIVLKG